MKGFVKILEAIVASVILLTSLSFFFTIASRSNWDDALLQTESQDIMASLDKSLLQGYIVANNKAAIENEIRNALPGTVGFSTTLEGVPNPEIFISCMCTEQEKLELEDKILRLDKTDPTRPFVRFKQRDVVIKVKNETFDNIDPRTDIVFVLGYQDLTPYRGSIDKHLKNGGNIFMLGQVANVDLNVQEIFGLEDAGSFSSSTPPGADFYDKGTAANTSFKIYNYFLGLGGNPTQQFGAFGERIKIDDMSIITVNGRSFAKVNYNITLGGKIIRSRAAWIGNYNYFSASDNEYNTSRLTTALILWTSGEEYSLDPVPKNVADVFQEYKYVGVMTGNEPFVVKLKVWRVF